MRTPKTVAEFKKWAKNPRRKPAQIISMGALVAYNEVEAHKRLPDRVLAIVAEECAIRWMEK